MVPETQVSLPVVCRLIPIDEFSPSGSFLEIGRRSPAFEFAFAQKFERVSTVFEWSFSRTVAARPRVVFAVACVKINEISVTQTSIKSFENNYW